MLTRDQIFAAQDIPPPEKVDVPEWGGDVYIRVMTGAERNAWDLSTITITGSGKQTKVTPNLKDSRAKLLVLTLCDETGKRLFTDQDVAKSARRTPPCWIDCLKRRSRSTASVTRISRASQKTDGPAGADLLVPAVSDIRDAGSNVTGHYDIGGLRGNDGLSHGRTLRRGTGGLTERDIMQPGIERTGR